MDQIKIGKFISSQRKSQKLTQEQIAEKLMVSKNAVSKWERGLNLPDVGIMEELCFLLKISINELFQGEKLKEKDIAKKSETNIMSILEYIKDKQKKRKIIFIILLLLISILCAIVIRFSLIKMGYLPDKNLAYTQLYLPGENNIQGEADYKKYANIHLDFEIGANKYGIAVFKNPQKALSRLKKDYSKGLRLIQKEFNLLPLNIFNYKVYEQYGWQVTTGSSKAQEEARFISGFFDIYENSFN